MAGKTGKNGDGDIELPPVGSKVRYTGTIASAKGGLFEVTRIIRGDERPLVITNGTRRLQVRVISVSVESKPAKPVKDKQGREARNSPPAEVGMLAWYRGPLRKQNGVVQVAEVEGNRLRLRSGVNGKGKEFFGPLDSIGRVTVAEAHDEDQILCGYCQSPLNELKSEQRCTQCHQRVVAITNRYEGINAIPSKCKLPEVPWDVAQLTTSK